MNPQMETTLPAGLRRVKMPDGTLSELIAWMHLKITQHAANSARWYHQNLAVEPDRLKASKPKREATPEEKRAKAAAHMRAYRKRIKLNREKLRKDLDSGALMRRVAMTKWKNRVRWYKKNRRRLLREGKWRGLPKKPDILTATKKPAR